jgi:transcription elongation GreA/GreB family factor
VTSGDQLVQVISCESPWGRAVWGKGEGDEVAMQGAARRQRFEVVWVR